MKNYKNKILFILPSLKAGGAERVISFVAQQIDKKRFDPVLIVVGFKKDAAYDISMVDTVFLNKTRVLSGVKDIFLLILKYRPKIVLTSIGHLNIIMGMFSLIFWKTKFIAREASVMSAIAKYAGKKNKIYDVGSNFAYKRLDHIICQSVDMLSDIEDKLNIPNNRLSIINNPITSLPDIKKDFSEVGSKTILNLITIGRLSKEKGHARLLEIINKLKIPFKYTIIGDGLEKEELFAKIEELKLSECIEYIQYTDKVSDYLSDNDIFLQGSYVEGFPNTVMESCIVGTPVVAFNVPGGTKEIISNGYNGFLVENEQEYINSIMSIYSGEFKSTPSEIRESVKNKFSKELILEKYENLFLKILKS